MLGHLAWGLVRQVMSHHAAKWLSKEHPCLHTSGGQSWVYDLESVSDGALKLAERLVQLTR